MGKMGCRKSRAQKIGRNQVNCAKGFREAGRRGGCGRASDVMTGWWSRLEASQIGNHEAVRMSSRGSWLAVGQEVEVILKVRERKRKEWETDGKAEEI